MNRQDELHPEDKRNLVIFVIAALAVWFVFDHYLLGPRLDKIREARLAEAQQTVSGAAGADGTPALGGEGGDGPLQERQAALEETQAQRIRIENGQVFGSLSLRGGRIDDLSLRDYFTALDGDENVVLLSPAGTAHAKYVELGWLAAHDGLRVPGKETIWRAPRNAVLSPGKPVVLTWNNGAGLRFEREIALDENFMFTVTERVVNGTGGPVTLFPYNRIAQRGVPEDFQGAYVVHEGPLAYLDGELIERAYGKMDEKEAESEFAASSGWIGISDKYWFTSLAPRQEGEKKFRFVYVAPETKTGMPRYQTDVVGAPVEIGAGERAEVKTHIFSGAKKVRLLEAYEKQLDIPHFDLAVDFGLYYFLTKPFFYILHFFGNLTGNFGLAIICLTIAVRLAVFPLANTSYRSFAKMKKIGPQMKELREQCGDDRVKLQEALVKLYEKEKVNPMAGCLPILIQIPIFFALFKILSVTIEMRHAPFFGWIQDLSAQESITVFNLFGLIPWEPPSFLMIGLWSCVMLGAMLVQRAMNPPPQDPVQAGMHNVMPFLITYILSRYAVGLVIYWAFSNTLSVIQQYVIMRSLGVEVHLFRRSKEDKEMEDMVRKGPHVHPGLEVVEDEVEKALFGDEDEAAKPISPPKPKKKKKR